MKVLKFAAYAAFTGPMVFAQSLSDLPACAVSAHRFPTSVLLLTVDYQQQAGLSGIEATGCSVTDIHCICNSVPFINTLRSYIEAQCDASDQASSFGELFVLSMHIR
jgi:CFEM domain